MSRDGTREGDTERERRTADERELLAALRRGEVQAMTTFFLRYSPILRREAARLGVDAAERRGLVDDALGDVLRAVQRPDGAQPRDLVAYTMIALRHAWRSTLRRERRQERVARAVYEEQRVHEPSAPPADAVLAQPLPTRSDDRRDGATDHDAAPTRHARVLALLTREVEGAITPEERHVLAWLADYVPQRDIARWLGTTHGAMRVRVHRLRERLRRGALRLGPSLDPPERLELERFLRRAGVTAPSTSTRRAPRGRSATDAETP